MNVIQKSAVWQFLSDKLFCDNAEAANKATHWTEAFNSSAMKSDLTLSLAFARMGKANLHSVALRVIAREGRHSWSFMADEDQAKRGLSRLL